MMRRSLTILGAAILLALPVSCGGGLANGVAQEPEFDPAGQTQCKVTKSQSNPLIVEWPSADRAQLESEVQSNVVVVAYDGCEMRLLPHCKAPGRYSYRGVTPKEDTVSIRNEDDLYANIPIYAAKFESKLASAGELNVAMTMVGRMETDTPAVRRDQLTGMCDGASHVVAGLTVGAFEFFAGAAAEAGAGVDVMGAGAGARSATQRETLTRDGTPEACRAEGDFSSAPPSGCTALLRVEVIELQADEDEGPAAEPHPPAKPDVSPKPPPTTHKRPPKPPIRSGLDRDKDGVPDPNDQCPDEPEDWDGFQDDDGCPDADNDRDGIPDTTDDCPMDPEDRDGHRDEDGCPDS